MSSTPSPSSVQKSNAWASARARLGGLWDATGMLLVFVILFGGASMFVDNFFGQINLISLALSVATVGILACTMLFCLVAGDFDLSIGSTVAMAGVTAAMMTNYSGSALIGFACGILAGGFVGLVNGFIIAKLRINALIATLATMQIVRGLGYIISAGKAVGVSQTSFFVLAGSWLSAPIAVWIMIACFIVFGLLLNKTTFGRNALAIGGNQEAARLAGINVARTKIIIFTMQGLLAGFAGVILASRMNSGQPMSSQGLELQVISACVLGGVSLTGGIGTMTGAIVGVLIMGTVQNAMNLKGIDPFYQSVASGSILLAAVLLDRLKQRGG